MNIRVVYPVEDPESYKEDISLVNTGIDEDNVRGFPLRFAWGLTKAVCIVAALLISFRVWQFIVDLITARGVPVIITGIFACIAFTVVLYTLLIKLLDHFESKTLRENGAEFLESYTLSEYVERTDEEKHADKVERYLERCGRLKASTLLDVQINLLNEKEASVEFLYRTRDGEQHSMDFMLSYEPNGYEDTVIVDLGRETLFLPAQAIGA